MPNSFSFRTLLLAAMAGTTATAPATAEQCMPIPGNPISFWSGNGSAMDDAGTNDGTRLAGVTFAEGQVDQAFEFDGSVETGVEIADTDDLRFEANFSLEAWVNTTAIGTPLGVHEYADVIRKRNRDNGGNLDILLGMEDGLARFAAVDDMGQFGSASGIRGYNPINDGEWHHLVGVREGNATYLYVDAVMEASLGDTTTTFVEVNSAPWVIGNSPGSIKFPWEGLVDEVGIFDRALPEDEILALYVAGSEGRCSFVLFEDDFEPQL